jgi:hypothetical protein
MIIVLRFSHSQKTSSSQTFLNAHHSSSPNQEQNLNVQEPTTPQATLLLVWHIVSRSCDRLMRSMSPIVCPTALHTLALVHDCFCHLLHLILIPVLITLRILIVRDGCALIRLLLVFATPDHNHPLTTIIGCHELTPFPSSSTSFPFSCPSVACKASTAARQTQHKLRAAIYLVAGFRFRLPSSFRRLEHSDPSD